jgi:hypothetical protein
MKCLTLEQIYLFLDKDLPPFQSQKIEEHLAICAKCLEAVEERKALLECAESLPDLEIPADFSQQVIAKIFPKKASLWALIAAFASGFACLVSALFILFRINSQPLPSLLLSYGRSLLNSIGTISLLVFKSFKLILLSIKILPEAGKELLKSFSSLTALISPPVQVIIITAVCLLFLSIIYGFGRRFFLENNHEK